MFFAHKNIRRPATHYQGSRRYFITLCCDERRNIFASGDEAIALIKSLREHSASRNFEIPAFCVMPDHFHALVFGLEPTSDLLRFIKSVKQETGFEYRQRHGKNLWQKKFYDYILRPNDSAERIAAYIWMNPVRAGLCSNPLQYPYSGSFTFDWNKVITNGEAWVPPWKAKQRQSARRESIPKASH